ncbi:protein kinase domain-containing protein [Yinghuangia seranimata]|uniref:protein kinase domain-containing protein n=1 Tax=Yinghuangia seranimata TaxID=408067 RepID=UPI00248BDAE9|nr:FKBP-type peptidyl-prolyl cis-trans isomerase [Yinghuangia seranimata]MDI2127714.1 FKBP-type peptidyl-prolyl cis-trans isomerase [Yinghuangia seranimata]
MGALGADEPAQVGPYRIERRLGQGGMGRVYLGRSPGGRAVAIKVVRPELADDPDFRRRFGREVAAARAVGGAFTAAVVDAEPDAAQPWLATVYVDGMALSDAVAAHGPWPADALRALGAGLAEALAAIHRAGVVHRDLKPSNVMLSADGPKVIDFGISLASEASVLTRTGSTVGSPGFMSPEQIDGLPVGPASDVFSLGAVLAFAARGEGPFGTGPTPALLYRVVHNSPDLGGVPEALLPVVAACLAKTPQERPTPDELLAALTVTPDAVAGPGTWLPADVAQTIAARGRAWHPPQGPGSGPAGGRTVPPGAPAHPGATATTAAGAGGVVHAAATVSGTPHQGNLPPIPPPPGSGTPPVPGLGRGRRVAVALVVAAIAALLVTAMVVLVVLTTRDDGTGGGAADRGNAGSASAAPKAATTPSRSGAPGTTPSGSATTPGTGDAGAATAQDGARQAPDVSTLDLGPADRFTVRVLEPGTGPAVTTGQTVVAHYVGFHYADHSVFDSSWTRGQTFAFRIGDKQVIAGFDEGLLGQKVGSRVLLVLPPDKAYGDTPADGSGIKPGETIAFVVDIKAAA